ncbi:NADH-FMN oxidoreductase RutF, flavin reductase (DIM6/NTAB) family [Abditibacterium utsteinense]|uniref:NADH-FMN oxidoreductase RutF, flavin reductase (DIM6/NTAB) family n=1 Tax=Abditibacterium utsteinense TaxID=1960156 RepID=A0A2S8SW98_9BACT|nr:flavin reductase family protein [Abditibacterium utsteinense]PQV65072.1 NADH-FMN oxidoreductase RutF, flavin reductase (DIM6/NTAB) family [Abditibacterium utsteinense]
MNDETWDKKSALRHLTYGVYVVSARRGEECNALTVRMVSQVCAQPPCVAVSLLKRRYTHDFICESRAFVINILAQGQELLGGHFGLRSGRTSNKMAGLEWEIGKTGAPILPDCSAFLECQLIAAHDVGNSTLFIGQVISQAAFSRPPLRFREEDYFG